MSLQNFAHGVWHPSGGDGLLPTIVAFHGHGAHGQDLMGLAPFLGGGRSLLLFPEAQYLLQPGALSYTWFASSGDLRRTPEEFERVIGLIRDFIDEALTKYGGDPNRVALLGFSQGGSIAYRLGLGEPERWRGVAALSTWLPEEAEAAGHAADPAGIAALPMLIQHGTQDPQITLDRARDSKTRLEALGAKPDYREYPMAHQIGNGSLRDLALWTQRVLDVAPEA